MDSARILLPILEPNKERKLQFQHHWLTSYSWLLYSEIKSGAFCRFCVVFAKCGGVGNQKLGFLSIEPFNNWKKAKEVFNKHSSLEYHKTAALKADSFLNVFSKKQKSIVDALDDDRSKQIINNRKRLLPIVECIILCGKQEIALRGHRDFGPIDFISASAKNEGNFREILKYKVKDDDCIRSFLKSEDNVNALKQLRTNIEPEFKKIFNEAQKMAEFLDFQIVVKKINKRQINRANPSLSSEEPEDHLRVTICSPYIKSFINQLELRFLEHHNIFKGFHCLFDNNEDSNEAVFESLVSFYLSYNDLSTTLGELKMWKLKLARLNVKPSNKIDALKLCSPVIFPNIHMLLKILCTLPVSTATPERMFLNLKRVKSYLRNTIKEDRLNGLTMLSVYRNINLTPEEVIDELGQKPRKIDIVL
ncbi:hypothetical protein QTP88_006359 [Uroleucon formosanum]